MNDGFLGILMLVIAFILSFILGIIICYQCAFYDKECEVIIEDRFYQSESYPLINERDGTISFKMKSGERVKQVELPYEEVIIKIKKK